MRMKTQQIELYELPLKTVNLSWEKLIHFQQTFTPKALFASIAYQKNLWGERLRLISAWTLPVLELSIYQKRFLK